MIEYSYSRQCWRSAHNVDDGMLGVGYELYDIGEDC